MWLEFKLIEGLLMDNHTYIIVHLCIYVIHLYYVYIHSWEKSKGVKAEKSVHFFSKNYFESNVIQSVWFDGGSISLTFIVCNS